MAQKAGIFIIHGDELLIGHPTNHDQNFYSVPKGKIDKGEDYVQAMLRELKEETDYDIDEFDSDMLPEYLGKFVYRNKKHSVHFFYIVLNNKPDKEAVCKSMVPSENTFPEVDWYKWVKFDEALKKCHEAQVRALRVLINKLR